MGIVGFQLGVETFSTPILKLMNKGTTAVQNLQTLKWLSEAGAVVEWNLLYGFPREDPADYAAMAEMLPSLYHLLPPRGYGRVRSDRFSPYFARPEAFGMANLRPSAAFAHAFPFPPDALARLAYYFDFDYADGRRVEEYVGPVLERVAAWRELPPRRPCPCSIATTGCCSSTTPAPARGSSSVASAGSPAPSTSSATRGGRWRRFSNLPPGGTPPRTRRPWRDACGLDRGKDCGLRGRSLSRPCPSGGD